MRKPAANIEKKIVAKILENVPDNQFTPVPYYYELLDSVGSSSSGIVCTESQSCVDFVLFYIIRDALAELEAAAVAAAAAAASEAARFPAVVYLHQSEEQCQKIAATLARHLPWPVVCRRFASSADDANSSDPGGGGPSVLVTTPSVLHRWMLLDATNSAPAAAAAAAAAACRLLVMENVDQWVQQHHSDNNSNEQRGYSTGESEELRWLRDLLDAVGAHQFVGSSTGLLRDLTGEQSSQLPSLIASLEATFRCPVTFASEVLSALIHGGQPAEEVLECPAAEDAFGLYAALGRLLQSHLDWLLDLEQSFEVPVPRSLDAKHFCVKALRQCLSGLDSLGPWGCNVMARVCLKHLISLEQDLAAEPDRLARCLVRATVTRLAMLQKCFHAAQEAFADVDDFRRVVPPSVHRLLDLLGRYRPRTEFTIEFISDSFGNGDAASDASGCAAGHQLIDELSDAASTDSDGEGGGGNGVGGGRVEITELNTNSLPYKVVPKCPTEQPTERLSALIFVRDCFTAYGLCKLLEEICIWDPDFFFVKPAYMFSLVTRPRQQRVTDYLRKFRQGETNLLVVTEALESRGDLPKCNLVVRFNPPRTFNSYFHSKNRARAFDSTYATVVTPADAAEGQFAVSHAAFKRTEDLLLRSGVDSGVRRARCCAEMPEQQEMEEESVDEAEVEPELFAPAGPNGASVSAGQAIPIVNRYCARLPSDVFACLVPLWQLETRSDGAAAYRCHLRLPMNSPCRRPVAGAWRATAQAAKESAALACVRALHCAGQLDAELRPFSKEDLLSQAAAAAAAEPGVSTSGGGGGGGGGSVGSSKRRQVYPKLLAAELSARRLPAAAASVGGTYWLYRIRLRPDNVWALPSAAVAAAGAGVGEAAAAVSAAACRRSFGLLLPGPLPDCLPVFCLYPRQGEVDVDFPLLNDSLALTPEQTTQLKQFHRVLFHRVLRLEKEATMVASFDESPFTPLICLLTRDAAQGEGEGRDDDSSERWSLDWDLAERVVTSSQDADSPCELKPAKPFVFRPEDFDDCVIVPSYRNFDQPQFYFVSQVRRDLSPASPFPTSAYDSFEEYYLKKYNIRLGTREQPLLDVEQSSSRYNVLTPRFLDSEGRPLGTRIRQQQQQLLAGGAANKDEQQKQLFVPELCYRHVVPASVWRQACCLPSALYRLNHLLLAESLRRQVSAATGVGAAASVRPHQLDKMAYCPLLPAAASASTGPPVSAAAAAAATATATVGGGGDAGVQDPNAATTDDADFGLFEHQPDDSDDLLADAGDFEDDDDDAGSTDSFEEMVAFFPRLRLASAPAPSAADILQCLTASNAGDLVNLERLETVGDSLLKFAVTVNLYCSNPGLHEGGLTQLRSRQVSNSHLYQCAAARQLGGLIVANKFEPRDNWLPPGLALRRPAAGDSGSGDSAAALVPLCGSRGGGGQHQRRGGGGRRGGKSGGGRSGGHRHSGGSRHHQQQHQKASASSTATTGGGGGGGFLQLEHSLTDKCLADSVEALIGCYLVRCNEQAALRVCHWFGISVGHQVASSTVSADDTGGDADEVCWPPPPEPLLRPRCEAELERRLAGYDRFEATIGYRFRNRAYLLQAFTHPSDYRNDLTDCYQRLEFLGDAVLDYVVTRYLFHDSRRHSPAVLTDLRSALVNNDIFGALAVKWGFHKFFRCVSPALHALIDQFVQFQKDAKEDNLDFVTSEEADLDDRAEDVEIPKCLGDIFESVAGAVFLDSGMCLDTVWRVFYPLMKERIECYTAEIPKSLVRELLETEPDCTKFERPTRTASGKIRVVVHIIGRGRFAGVGRNYRIARNSAAKVALRFIKAKEREEQTLDDADTAPAAATAAAADLS